MPKVKYRSIKFQADTRALIDAANAIINEYAAQGFDLTLRQLYYQFVARDLLPNNLKSYKRLGSVVNDARMAGLIDWERIEDRTREVDTPTTWSNPAEIVAAVAKQFRIDKWQGQEYRIEVWVEKEALAGVFAQVCRELQLSLLSCRGYTSQSEMWRAGRRMKSYQDDGQQPMVLHFGDHDPSGLDMSRDIKDRLELFMGGVEFDRLALNRDQVEEHSPPPNPAKMTDSRADVYVEEHGDESWELDALNPTILAALVRDRVLEVRDQDLWDERAEEENEHRRLLAEVSGRWDELTGGL